MEITPWRALVNLFINLILKHIHSKLVLTDFWIFPYFMESQIFIKLPKMAMLDYKVEYTNHSQFQKGIHVLVSRLEINSISKPYYLYLFKGPKGRKQGSPVRIFTNLSLQKFQLPASEGYRFCSLCKKWISPENKHCSRCNSCTSKVAILRCK